MTAPQRREMTVWIPDWPVHALLRELAEQASPANAVVETEPANAAVETEPAIALLAKHRVVACSPAARAAGVRVGIREREAQLRCPTIALHPHSPETDSRRFAPVLAALEGLIPGIECIRPGMCSVGVRGPARYYGGERAASEAVLEVLAGVGFSDARIGVAEGRFASEQAARSTSGEEKNVNGDDGCGGGGIETEDEAGVRSRIRVVAEGESAGFLAPLPVSRAADPALVDVLHGLGIRTLGALSALPEESVQQRFGEDGVIAHRLASGGSAPPAPQRRGQPHQFEHREVSAEVQLDPPVDGTEQLAFACSGIAEQLTDGLIEAGLVCTELRIELFDEVGARHERVWAHPRHFRAFDVVNRVRWQSDAVPRAPERGGAGIALVRLVALRTDHAAAHEPGLWNTAADERVHHHLSRLQSAIGHEGVRLAEIGGGRLLTERQVSTPWGSQTARSGGRAGRAPAAPPAGAVSSAEGPWAGRLSGAVPSTVYPQPIPVILLGTGGAPVGIDREDRLTAEPRTLNVPDLSARGEVSAWSQVWPIRERWWLGAPPRFRAQVELANGDAWVLLHQNGQWFAEGRYD